MNTDIDRVMRRLMITLGLLKIGWWRDKRAYITLPSDDVYVQALAGRKKGAVITLIFDTSECRDEEASKLHGTSSRFVGTISIIRRTDGGFWYRIAIPLRISRMLTPYKDCTKAQVFIEPWLTSRKAVGTARILSRYE
jgi:hypothetical protein